MTTTRDQFLTLKNNYDKLLAHDLNFKGDDASWEEHGTRTADALEAVMLAPAADLSCIHDKLSILWSDMKQMAAPGSQDAERELTFIAAIKADVTALGATPANTLGGYEPMTGTPTTPICALAREATQLQADVSAAERAMSTIKTNTITAESYLRLQTLDAFCGDACDRLDAIQQSITTAVPEALEDVLILAAVAAQMVQRVNDDEKLHPSRRAVTRMLTNITAYLEAKTGATAATLGAGGFGDIIRPWSKTAAEAREILASLQPAKAA